MFRYKRKLGIDYNRQGYIYFTSRRYRKLSDEAQREILNLCMECGGEYYQALFEFVTTDTTATALGLKHFVSRATLYRAVRRYYQQFPDQI